MRQANNRNIEAVFLGGHLRKWRGQLLDVNLSKLRDLVYESRQYLFDQRGFELNIFAQAP